MAEAIFEKDQAPEKARDGHPDFLYHYTRLPVLFDIYKESELRLSDLLTSNDLFEDRLASMAILKSRKRFGSFTSGQIVSMLDIARQHQLFAGICFTSAKNDTLMHQAYNDGKGVCLEIEYDKLNAWAGKIRVGGKNGAGLELKKVNYVDAQRLKELGNSILPNDSSFDLNRLIDNLAFAKLINWEHEHEYRIAFRLYVNAPDTMPLFFDGAPVEKSMVDKGKADLPRLYYSFPFDLSAIKSIYLAPSCPVNSRKLKRVLAFASNVKSWDMPEVIDYLDSLESHESDKIDDDVSSFKRLIK